MIRYFEIYPIRDDKHDMFDTVSYVGWKSGKTFNDMFYILGFDSASALIAYGTKKSIDYSHFSIEKVLMDRLNAYCKAKNLPLRISPKPYIRRGND